MGLIVGHIRKLKDSQGVFFVDVDINGVFITDFKNQRRHPPVELETQNMNRSLKNRSSLTLR